MAEYRTPDESIIKPHLTILDWLKLLHDEYYTMCEHSRQQYLVKINNWISKDMHWNRVYNMEYDPETYTLTFTGFPKHTWRQFFKFNESQIYWVLHRIGYNHAKLYYFHEHAIKLELLLNNNIKHHLIEVIPLYDICSGVSMEDENNNCGCGCNSNCTGCNILKNPCIPCEHEHDHCKCKCDKNGVEDLDI